MNISLFPMSSPRSRGLWLTAATSVVMVAAGAVTWLAMADTGPLQKTLQVQFPRTPISAVNCSTAVPGLCEVTAGKNLFYATRDGRFVVVGSLLDLKRKVDLTDERLRQLAEVNGAVGHLASANTAAATEAPLKKLTVDLPAANAILHNPGAPLKVKVFSDFNCGYCRMFFTSLAGDKRFEVTEYPIAILGADSVSRARSALCAKDRPLASLAIYAGAASPAPACPGAATAIDQNTSFARQHGISGTPTIIRADGAVNAGFLAPSALKDFVEKSS